MREQTSVSQISVPRICHPFATSSANLPELLGHDIGTPRVFSPFLSLFILSPFPSLCLSLLFSLSSLSSTLFFCFFSLSCPMLDGCQGSKGNSCDCQQFVPRRSKRNRCKTCGHRHTAHLSAQSTAPTSPTLPAADGAIKPMAKPEVNYRGRVLKSFGTSTAHQLARKETLLGYRPLSNKVCIATISRFHAPHIN